MNLKVGTRGSPLALAQTKKFIKTIEAQFPDISPEIVVIKTAGDKRQASNAPADHSDKQDWVKGLDIALINGEIDCAIHSGKDVPIDIHPGTDVLPVGERAASQDVFIPQSGSSLTLQTLPANARIGTSSLRRKAQLLSFRSDLQIVSHRGNIQTRIDRLFEDKNLSGIILAAAGLERLNIDKSLYQLIDTNILVPAICQGVVFAQYKKNNTVIYEMIQSLSSQSLKACFTAERETVRILQANCHSALGVYAQVTENELSLFSRVMSEDGSRKAETRQSGLLSAAKEIGRQAAEDLILKGATGILSSSTRAQAGWKIE